MTTCDNGGSTTKELPRKRAHKSRLSRRLREKGVMTPELKKKIEKRALREKPKAPYKLASYTQECAHPECAFIRININDPHSLCKVHAWKKRYGIKD